MKTQGRRFFVAGTDTGVGKTLVTSALLLAAAQKGHSTLGLKPVAAGCEQTEAGLRNEDALALHAASTVKLSYEQTNPVALREAIAPHLAAKHENRSLQASRLAGLCRGALPKADLVLVEGAGGWRVPLTGRETLAQLAIELQLPVILVVGIRLGCLNHALLTAEAIRNDRLPLAGWVANVVDPGTACIDENIETLERWLGAPRLASVPYTPQVRPGQLIQQIDIAPLGL
jgi:dethiobiotin synthetase